jgi:hypothetical protein
LKWFVLNPTSKSEWHLSLLTTVTITGF